MPKTPKSEDGYLIQTPHDGSKETVLDCVNCCHCGRIFPLNDAITMIFRDQMGFCLKCRHPTCPGGKCEECVPQEKALEIMEGADPATVQVGGFQGGLWLP